MRRVTRYLRTAALAAAAVSLSGSLLAQTPTPTPTATPTPTPTPVPVNVPASISGLAIPDGGRIDASNMVFDADGTIWSGSADSNVLLRISPDETKVRKWTMPKYAAPSHLLKEPDGKIWVTQLGGFKVSRFNPETAELTEWADTARRPTALVKRADGTFWLPETNGSLAGFDPATGTFTYWRSEDTANPILSLSYPFLDVDGAVWCGDFTAGTIVRFAPDGSKAKIWKLPSPYAQPSKIIRGPDGALWISLYNAGQLARFDPATAEMKTFDVGTYALPFDMKVYKDRIVYTEQTSGEVGVFAPGGSVPSSTSTLEAAEVTLTSTTATATPVTTTLTFTDVDVTTSSPLPITGSGFPGVARYPVIGGSAYALHVDEGRKRFLVGGPGEIVQALPPLAASADDHFYPAASSIPGRDGTRWVTQLVGWNRGTADSTGATAPTNVTAFLHPTDWILGLLPTASLGVEAGRLFSDGDPISGRMGGGDVAGALRITANGATTKLSDFYSWIRVARTRADGGTHGFARNSLKAGHGIGEGETGVVLTPPDASAYRVNAGLLVVEKAKGTVSIHSSEGALLAGPFAYDWPAGYQVQASTIFEAFLVPPAAAARITFSVTKGRVLPFGTAIDVVSGDPMDLPFFGPRTGALNQWVLGVERGGGSLGPTSRTDLLLYNPAAADTAVSIGFRTARLASDPAAAPRPSVSFTVPAGRVVTLRDVVKERFGLEGVAGSMDVVSDPPVAVLALVTAEDASGGRHGYGSAAVLGDAGPGDGARGVFIQASDAGWDVMESELQVTNPTDGTAQVTVRAFDAEGVERGTGLSLSVGPKEVLRLPAAFYTVSGNGAALGRLEVVPAAGSPPVFAVLVRQDKKSGDADAIVPYVVPSS